MTVVGEWVLGAAAGIGLAAGVLIGAIGVGGIILVPSLIELPTIGHDEDSKVKSSHQAPPPSPSHPHTICHGTLPDTGAPHPAPGPGVHRVVHVLPQSFPDSCLCANDTATEEFVDAWIM